MATREAETNVVASMLGNVLVIVGFVATLTASLMLVGLALRAAWWCFMIGWRIIP